MILAFLLLAAQSAFTVTQFESTTGRYDGRQVRASCGATSSTAHALDLRKWRYDTARNKRGWFNRELQYYSAGGRRTFASRNGVLDHRRAPRNARARHSRLGRPRITPPGKIVSKPGWTYGFYEIRAKLPCARGTWPAIWMLPVDNEEMARRRRDRHHGAGRAEPNLIYRLAPHEAFQLTPSRPSAARSELVPTSCSSLPRLSARLAAGFDHYRRRRPRDPAGSQQRSPARKARGHSMRRSK